MKNKSWKCVRCEKINAPWLPYCHCEPNKITKEEELKKIISEKWLIMFTDLNGEIVQGMVSNYKDIPKAIDAIISYGGKNICLEDKTLGRYNNYNEDFSVECPFCFELQNGITKHVCKAK